MNPRLCPLLFAARFGPLAGAQRKQQTPTEGVGLCCLLRAVRTTPVRFANGAGLSVPRAVVSSAASAGGKGQSLTPFSPGEGGRMWKTGSSGRALPRPQRRAFRRRGQALPFAVRRAVRSASRCPAQTTNSHRRGRALLFVACRPHDTGAVREWRRLVRSARRCLVCRISRRQRAKPDPFFSWRGRADVEDGLLRPSLASAAGLIDLLALGRPSFFPHVHAFRPTSS